MAKTPMFSTDPFTGKTYYHGFNSITAPEFFCKEGNTMKKAIVFEALREGYGIDQIRRPMTVGDLMEFLEDIDPDTLFILSHDSGYTYGTIDTRTQVTTYREREDGEWEPDEWED